MTTTAAPDALFGAVSAVAAEVTGELAAVLARLGELTDAAVAAEATGDLEADAARIDQIATLERIQAAAAATQAALMVGFARSQVEAQQQAVLADPRAVGRGIADQLALACRGVAVGGVAAARGGPGPARRAAFHGCAATRRPDQRVRCRARRVGIPSPRPGPAPSRRRSSGRRAGRLRSTTGGDAGPEVRLRGRPAGLRAARAHRPCRPPGRAAPSAGHDGDPVGVPARRAGCGVPGGAAHAHRLGQEHRRSAQPRPDHGGHPG